MIIAFVVGVVVGGICMYLIARNSPNHFLKIKKFADAVTEKVKQELSKNKQ